MVDSQRLYDIIKYNNFSTREVAQILGLSVENFRKKLRQGVFNSNEIEIMLHFLHFPCNPMKVFFNTYDYENPKKIPWADLIEQTGDGRYAKEVIKHRP